MNDGGQTNTPESAWYRDRSELWTAARMSFNGLDPAGAGNGGSGDHGSGEDGKEGATAAKEGGGLPPAGAPGSLRSQRLSNSMMHMQLHMHPITEETPHIWQVRRPSARR